MGVAEVLVYVVGFTATAADTLRDALQSAGFACAVLPGLDDADIAIGSLIPDAIVVHVAADRRATADWLERLRDPDLTARTIAVVAPSAGERERAELAAAVVVDAPVSPARLIELLRGLFDTV